MDVDDDPVDEAGGGVILLLSGDQPASRSGLRRDKREAILLRRAGLPSVRRRRRLPLRTL